MKRFFFILIVVVSFIFVPCLSTCEEYSPALDTTMEQFISDYNAIGSPLGSPLLPLGKPTKWTSFQGKAVAWFKADSNSDVTILLLSGDKSAIKELSSGLDEIQIYTSHASNMAALISVALRCTKLFATEIFSISLASMRITDVITYYYENNLKSKNYYSIGIIDSDEKYELQYWEPDSDYYFAISPNEM